MHRCRGLFGIAVHIGDEAERVVAGTRGEAQLGALDRGSIGKLPVALDGIGLPCRGWNHIVDGCLERVGLARFHVGRAPNTGPGCQRVDGLDAHGLLDIHTRRIRCTSCTARDLDREILQLDWCEGEGFPCGLAITLIPACREDFPGVRCVEPFIGQDFECHRLLGLHHRRRLDLEGREIERLQRDGVSGELYPRVLVHQDRTIACGSSGFHGSRVVDADLLGIIAHDPLPRAIGLQALPLDGQQIAHLLRISELRADRLHERGLPAERLGGQRCLDRVADSGDQCAALGHHGAFRYQPFGGDHLGFGHHVSSACSQAPQIDLKGAVTVDGHRRNKRAFTFFFPDEYLPDPHGRRIK